MSALSRTYGRRIRPLDPTPVPHLAAIIVPLILLGAIIVLALHMLHYASKQLLLTEQPGVSSAPSISPVTAIYPDPPRSLQIFAPGVRAWERDVFRWSKIYGLPPTLVAIVMQIESCGSPDVESSAGAKGLFQVMPFHFSPHEDPFDPEVNAARGLAYLARSFELAGGAIDKTLAGYNGGHSVIEREPTTWPDETQRYVSWGTGIWEDIESNRTSSETLNLWLAAGGEHLCRRAIAANQGN